MFSDIGTSHLLTVEPEATGERLDRFVAAKLPQLSRTRIRRLIEAGFITVAGRAAVDPDSRMNADEKIEVVLPHAEEPEPLAQAMELDIVYEDDDLLVVDKPAGLVVHPAPGNPENTLVNALIAHCGDTLSGIGGVKRPGIVHRLDKETSGLMLVAKHDAAHLGLSAQFATHDIERSYKAVVWGTPPIAMWTAAGKNAETARVGWGRIEGAIGRSARNRQKMAVVRSGGKHAVTRYRVLEAFGPSAEPVACLIECRLETGRTHQIRVHMTHIGHPLLGDPVYGGGQKTRSRRLPQTVRPSVDAFERQALHAASLGFVHPRTGEILRFTSQLPPDMAFLLSALRTI